MSVKSGAYTRKSVHCKRNICKEIAVWYVWRWNWYYHGKEFCPIRFGRWQFEIIIFIVFRSEVMPLSQIWTRKMLPVQQWIIDIVFFLGSDITSDQIIISYCHLLTRINPFPWEYRWPKNCERSDSTSPLIKQITRGQSSIIIRLESYHKHIIYKIME